MNIIGKDGQHLHTIIRGADIKAGREDVSSTDQFLQLALLKLPQGKTFKPHRHRWETAKAQYIIPQESWVVISGNVEVTLYDLDNTVLHVDVLTPGDISITYEGGHNYEILSEDSLVYEFKTGPYYGQEIDKTFI